MLTERNLTRGTIETHLIPFIADGEIEITDLVTAKKQQLILNAAAIHGTLSHKTLIENLPEGMQYHLIIKATNHHIFSSLDYSNITYNKSLIFDVD